MAQEQDRNKIKTAKPNNSDSMKKGFGTNTDKDKDADKRKSEIYGKDDKKKEFDKKHV